ncbi:MAG: hypothetical protein CL878_10985 [Dehalococcoidia bacterium]|nr:hypothetical protein [Dehalococcoidia bacterium]
MDVANTVLMRGDPQFAFTLAAAVEDWPRLLPHYRSVAILAEQGHRRHVRMAALRTGIPVAWTAWQEVLLAEDRITYHHTGGRLIAMEVEWSFQPTADGVQVQLAHHYEPQYRWLPRSLQPWLAEQVAGRFFVQHIAGQTLRVLRDHVEAAGR